MTVETTYQKLLTRPEDVTISESEANEVWIAFQGNDSAISARPFKVRAFMQACMMGWLDASVGISWFQAILMASLKPSSSIIGLVGRLLRAALKTYYRNEIKGTPPLYLMVRDTIVQQNRPYFLMISQGLDLP